MSLSSWLPPPQHCKSVCAVFFIPLKHMIRYTLNSKHKQKSCPEKWWKDYNSRGRVCGWGNARQEMTGLFKNSCNVTSALVLFSFKLGLSWRILPVFSHAVWYIANDAESQKTLPCSSVWSSWGFPRHISRHLRKRLHTPCYICHKTRNMIYLLAEFLTIH